MALTPTLAELTTLRVGGPIGTLLDLDREADIIDAVRDADTTQSPLLVLGGGSNVVASDDGFAGVVVRDRRESIEVADEPTCGGVTVTVAAGTPWDHVVARAVDEGWVGIEALSGIPGSTGATPVQNVGAYGQEVAETVAQVRTWDREELLVRTFAASECGFGYRDSLLKRTMRGATPDGEWWHPTPRFVVLAVTFQLLRGHLGAPVAYDGVARAVGVGVGERAPARDVREAVMALRRAKGMVLDREDPDTCSAGSFFVNPVVSAQMAASLPDDAPRHPAAEGSPDGSVKTSAAWLIEHAGYGRGFRVTPDARAAISGKHTLALTNRGGATAAEVVALARQIRDGVREAFSVVLVPEPILVGTSL